MGAVRNPEPDDVQLKLHIPKGPKNIICTNSGNSHNVMCTTRQQSAQPRDTKHVICTNRGNLQNVVSAQKEANCTISRHQRCICTRSQNPSNLSMACIERLRFDSNFSDCYTGLWHMEFQAQQKPKTSTLSLLLQCKSHFIWCLLPLSGKASYSSIQSHSDCQCCIIDSLH